MRRLLPLIADPVAVAVFVAIGRRNHAETDGFSGYVETVAPFLIAVVAGWVVARAWQRPLAPVTGAVVAGVTAVLGLTLRNLVFGEGTQTSFLFVATAFLFFFIVGWRLVALQFRRLRAAGV